MKKGERGKKTTTTRTLRGKKKRIRPRKARDDKKNRPEKDRGENKNKIPHTTSTNDQVYQAEQGERRR